MLQTGIILRVFLTVLAQSMRLWGYTLKNMRACADFMVGLTLLWLFVINTI